MSKTELDLILFSAISKYSERQDTSDFALSRYLQITPQRVRNLKSRASVKYCTMSQAEAIENFIQQSSDAKADGDYLDIPIKNIAVSNEIEAILDSRNLLLHTQRNPKIFRLRVDDFLELFIQLELISSKGKKKEAQIETRIINALKKKASKSKELKELLTVESPNTKNWTKTTLKNAMLTGGLAFGIDLLATMVPGGSLFSGQAKSLLESISKKL